MALNIHSRLTQMVVFIGTNNVGRQQLCAIQLKLASANQYQIGLRKKFSFSGFTSVGITFSKHPQKLIVKLQDLQDLLQVVETSLTQLHAYGKLESKLGIFKKLLAKWSDQNLYHFTNSMKEISYELAGVQDQLAKNHAAAHFSEQIKELRIQLCHFMYYIGNNICNYDLTEPFSQERGFCA